MVTYVGKDIANQFWKLGLLGKDFHYRRFEEQANGKPLWATTSTAGEAGAPPFGHAGRIYNVIDSRQMYLQALLKQALETLGHAREAENSIHFSYEMVALSHATARELGYEREGDAEDKPFVEVSGRKGLGVKIDDLLDLLTAKASAEVAKRNPEFSDEERAQTASRIAVAAIRYFMLKFSRGKLIVFDIEEALSFEGETGPYLQYAVVRANNIFGKLKEREGLTEADLHPGRGRVPGGRGRARGRWCWKRRGSTRSSNRSSARSSSRRWRSTRSAWRSCSMRSTIARRSSTRRTSIESGGARPAWPISARN